MQDGIGIKFNKFLPVRIAAEVEMIPVIHTGAAQMLFIKGKSERIDQMKNASGGNGKPADGSGVLGDFGGDKNDIERGHFFLSNMAANMRSQLQFSGMCIKPQQLFPVKGSTDSFKTNRSSEERKFFITLSFSSSKAEQVA